MGHFFAGFLAASMLWSLAGYLYLEGKLNRFLGEPAVEVAEDEARSAAAAKRSEPRKRRRRQRRRARRAAPRSGQAVTGDDIDWDGPREVDMGGGEAQLSREAIDAGFDGVFGAIRRCLLLVPGDAVAQGKLVFGMRVASNGRPSAVNLSGPAAVTTGEAGNCLRKAARSIQFPDFDGPEMVFRYPIELE